MSLFEGQVQYINVEPTLEKLPALSELLPLLESDLEGIDKLIYKT